MKSINLLLLCIVIGAFLVISPIAYGKVLWKDTFDDNKIDSKYLFQNQPGKWVEANGVISQTNPNPGDHCYLVIQGGFPEPHTSIVKIRIDDWADHDLSRAGLGMRLNKDDGAGYAFLIHHTLDNLEFLNDHLAWKNNDTKPPFGKIEIGKWYWMKAQISSSGLNGKIWPDGQAEPAGWLLTSALDFGAVRPASGNCGLNGGSNTAGNGRIGVSFDNWAICETPEEATPALFASTTSVNSSDKLSTTWGNIKLKY